MNKLKKIFISTIAILMVFVCATSFAGCKNIKKVSLQVSVYNFSNSQETEYSLDIELYAHLAPETAQSVLSMLKDGYYNDTVFYKMDKYAGQLMIGDLKYDPDLEENEGFYLNDVKPTIKGEFERGGTTGSNLKNKEGSIGLWRTWAAQDSSYNSGSSGMDTGRATWFMPLENISTYDGYFCVFGQYDLEDEDNKETMEAIQDFFNSNARYQEYVIYYTGEYGNLTFHCVSAENFKEEEIVDLFKTEENSAELVCYNHYKILVPMTTSGSIGAKIVGVK